MVVGIHPHDRTFSAPYTLHGGLMSLLTMRQAAKHLGVAPQSLAYYFHRGKLTGKNAGGVILVDPETAKKELQQAGFYEIREKRRSRKRSASIER